MPLRSCLAIFAIALSGYTVGENERVSECSAFAHVDQAALPSHLNNDPADERLDAIWARWSQDQPDIAWRTRAPDATVRLETSDGMVEHPGRREIVGRRSEDGWELYARSSSLSGPLVAWSPWAPVQLSPRAASRLDALLADPCLWNAPPFLDGEVRLKNGQYDSRPDGPLTGYDISAGGRRWGGWHFSWIVGAPGQIRGILLAEAFGLPEYPLDEIGPDGWINKPQDPG
jgi:predicted outer membrane lipoprotein